MTLARVGMARATSVSCSLCKEFCMKRLVNIAAEIAVAGSLGLAALGIGTGVANAAPPMAGTQWAQDWGPGPGP